MSTRASGRRPRTPQKGTPPVRRKKTTTAAHETGQFPGRRRDGWKGFCTDPRDFLRNGQKGVGSMMQGRFRPRCLAAILTALVGVSTWVPSALASVAYNGTRGLLRTRSADTFHKGTLSFQISEQYGKQNDEELLTTLGADSAIVDFHTFITRASLTYA